MYGVLNDIFGKGKFLEGLVHFTDEKGQKSQLSNARKIALVASSLLCLSVGATMGALNFGFFINLSHVAILSFLATGVGASIVPPVAIFLAAFITVCITILILSAFSKALQTKNLESILTKPFKEVSNIFDPSHEENRHKSSRRLKIEKTITLIAVGFLVGIGLFGLAMMCCSSTSSLGHILSNTFHLSIPTALLVSKIVGDGIALVGQILFVIQSAAGAAEFIARSIHNLCANKTSNNSTPSSPNTDAKHSSTWNTVVHYGGKLVHYVSCLISAIGTGLLSIQGILTSTHSPLMANLSAAASGMNSFNAALAVDNNQDRKIQMEASFNRIQKILGADNTIPSNAVHTNNPLNISTIPTVNITPTPNHVNVVTPPSSSTLRPNA
jgi:hypothetical protein